MNNSDMYKVYYVDEKIYEGRQLIKYLDNIKPTKSQKEISSMMVLCDFNVSHTAQMLGKSQSNVSVSWSTIKNKIYKHLDANNIQIKEAPHKEVNLASVAKWYETGIYSAIELSKLFGVSARVIQYYCEKHNIKSPSAERYSIRYTIDDVRKEFKKEGYQLLTQAYSHQNDRLEYICPEGHKGITTFHYWKHNGHRCPECHERVGSGNYTIVRAERMKDVWLDTKAYIYIVRLTGINEEFYKMGISVNPQNRFYNFPYHVDIVKLYETNLYTACYVEDWLLESFEHLSYTPNISFGGETECFTAEGLESVLNL